VTLLRRVVGIIAKVRVAESVEKVSVLYSILFICVDAVPIVPSPAKYIAAVIGTCNALPASIER
jgi:hypothetical protein